MAWDPDSRSNFFSEPAHQCAVTCLTEYRWLWRYSAKNEPEPKIYISCKCKNMYLYIEFGWKCSKWRVCHLLVFKGNKFGEDVQIKKKNTSMTRLHWRRRRGGGGGTTFKSWEGGTSGFVPPPPHFWTVQFRYSFTICGSKCNF